MAERGKISKTGRASTQFGKGGAQVVVIENDSSRGKVFVEIKKLLAEAKIGFQNLSSGHPIIINKGQFAEATGVIKTALVEGEGARYTVEVEDSSQIVLVENTTKEPAKMVVKESPFAWYAGS
ncbi:MAG: hypothetical protein GX139_10670 [Armatimonadetes bacterium]|nr:hypothetical protein [Armatimonadota bacterium]